MREIGNGINQAKQKVKQLIGVPMLIKVDTGRGRSVLYHGTVSSVFPSVFTIILDSGDTKTFSYSDVHTNGVLFLPNETTII